jgi:NDP-sugar pyrophosphorylase family protein
LANTGLYVIEPNLLRKIPSNAFIHTTEIIQQLMSDGEKVGVYPIGETNWMDIGQINMLEEVSDSLTRLT